MLLGEPAGSAERVSRFHELVGTRGIDTLLYKCARDRARRIFERSSTSPAPPPRRLVRGARSRPGSSKTAANDPFAARAVATFGPATLVAGARLWQIRAMNVEEFVQQFLGSEHGRSALDAVTATGVSPDDAQQYLTHAAAAAHAHVEEHAQSSGLLGDNVGKSFFAAFASGLVRGDGLLGSLGDGLEGVLVGRIAEALADKVGLDQATAATVAAAATPYIAAFVKSKLSG